MTLLNPEKTDLISAEEQQEYLQKSAGRLKKIEGPVFRLWACDIAHKGIILQVQKHKTANKYGAENLVIAEDVEKLSRNVHSTLPPSFNIQPPPVRQLNWETSLMCTGDVQALGSGYR
ncbi:uncharacterized protein LOC117122961 [Anneissia japonica]|uniref:uncharacterized protein LOC117122961 n=1 Tax=Anneissia japonica TaxID=1529436 RepID=UPI001425739A|nr:uncharacterized protein LOC117122961 [Anneissia japonica]